MKFTTITSLMLTAVMALSISIPAYAKEDQVATVITQETSKSYASFEEAWNQAVSLGKTSQVTITLEDDWTADESGNLGKGDGFLDGALHYAGKENLTLDLNGYCIDRNLIRPRSNGAVLYLDSQMTIVDSRSDEYTVSDLFQGGAIQNGANEEAGGGIVIADKAKLALQGGTLRNCVSTDEGGAISISGQKASLEVNGAGFYGNRTYDSSGECCGGAIYSDEASLNIENATFEGNYAEDDGGAIYVNDGTCNIRDSFFYANSSREEGGAIYCNSSAGTYLYDCQMYENHSATEGGAVYVDADKVFLVGGNYQYNTADQYGGGIYVDSMYDVNVSGKLIVKDNTSQEKESDLCLQDGMASAAYLYAGGLYEDSGIWLCSTDTGSQLIIKGIDKYQYENYIHFDQGYSLDKTVESQVDSDEIRAEASIFGKGNVGYILAGILLIIVVAALGIVVKKKKGAKTDEQKKS